MVWFPSILMGVIYALVGLLIKHDPKLLSGYSTMSAERKKLVDIETLGRFCTKLLYLAAVLSFAGLPALLFGAGDHTVVGLSIFTPIPVLLIGWIWGWGKYDAKDHK